MKRIDRYILKRYLFTIVILIVLFIPIGILIDLSEKVSNMTQSGITTKEITSYYFSFAVYFADILLPLFLFISIIWFTSRLAQNTEIIAVLSAGISFQRLLKPYLIGAFIVGFVAFGMEMFVVPKASEVYQDFSHKYVYKNDEVEKTAQIFTQANDSQYIYVSDYHKKENTAYNFTLESFHGEQMMFKISAERIFWMDSLQTYRLYTYVKRDIGELGDRLDIQKEKDTVLPFKIERLSHVNYIAETKTIFELSKFIKEEKERGDGNVNRYLLVAYKRWTLPVTLLILTFMAVSVSSKKRRGGLGMNLFFGMVVAFVYVFFDKILGVMVANSNFNPLLAIIIPNVLFGTMAFFMIRNSKK